MVRDVTLLCDATYLYGLHASQAEHQALVSAVVHRLHVDMREERQHLLGLQAGEAVCNGL